jgi:hypothetical protein
MTTKVKRSGCHIVEWKPEWASTWRDHRDHEPGVVEWNGLLLDGWEPL